MRNDYFIYNRNTNKMEQVNEEFIKNIQKYIDKDIIENSLYATKTHEVTDNVTLANEMQIVGLTKEIVIDSESLLRDFHGFKNTVFCTVFNMTSEVEIKYSEDVKEVYRRPISSQPYGDMKEAFFKGATIKFKIISDRESIRFLKINDEDRTEEKWERLYNSIVKMGYKVILMESYKAYNIVL